MRRQAVRVVRLSVGAALVILGVIGGFIPILQGWIFILAGLTVMAPESRRARGALDWLKERVEKVRERRKVDTHE